MERSDSEKRWADMPSKDTLLKAKIHLRLNHLFGVFLTILDDVVEDHDDAMGKLIDALPDDQKKLVILADYLGEHRVKAIRKRVLDVGNGILKELQEEVENLEG